MIAILVLFLGCICCCIIGSLIMICYKKKCTTPIPEKVIECDRILFEASVESMVTMGYQIDDAIELIKEAFKQSPNGDINDLVNVALRL